ncbi:MAG TPA: DNA-directed DNA polymerase I, partial [Candidatus Lokiarchaeia archaeon]|nr:DNA-directed DNA polymerase I [Candidatus Lokiarchaeia archaeon]
PKAKAAPQKNEPLPELTEQQQEKLEHLFTKHAHQMNEGTFGINTTVLASLGGDVVQTSRYLVSLVEGGRIPLDLGPSLLLDVDYDGHLNKAYAKLYNLEDKQIYLWVDTTGHEPYCLCPSSPDRLLNYGDLATFDGLARIETKQVHDLLEDREREVSEVIGHTPTDIGGAGRAGRGNIKNILTAHDEIAWEANIRYHHNYIFDRSLVPGLVYSIQAGSLVKEDVQLDPDTLAALTQIFQDEPPELCEYAQESVKIFEAPIPDIRRMAMDIEVAVENGKIPNARIAREPVICISFVSNDGLKKIFVLVRDTIPAGEKIDQFPEDLEIEIFDDEKELLRETFRLIWAYPIVITFNGDNFDFHYLYNRANKLKIPSSEIPFKVRTSRSMMGSSVEIDLYNGIHVDLYKFFSDRSIKGYAFGNKYGQNSLDSITNALLGQGKFQHPDQEIHELSLFDLMYYNWKDSDITFQLTTFDGSIVMRLLILFIRMTKLPLHDFYRNSISPWIRTMLYFEHRQRNFLIPRKEDIAEKFPKQGFSTSVIEGKQFQGAFVIDPTPGRHYGVVVMDFASLYPTIIKEYNLSYETINCGHPECRNNLIPNTPYYVCTRRMGIFALLTGFFREVRIKWYKKRAGDKTLPPEERSAAATIQSALKVFINGSYGVFGSRQFPLFALPVGESTTAIGRYSIQKTIQKAQELGTTVLYGDTDSVFLLQPTEDQIKTLTGWAEKELRIDLEVDKTYQFLALSSRKKNYAGIYGNGGVDIKGLTGKKKNTPEFIKIVFLEVLGALKEVKSEDDFVAAKESILSTIRKNVKKLERRDFPLEDFEVTVQMKKKMDSYVKTMPQHVRAAKMLEESKKQQGFDPDLERGDSISYVKTRDKDGVKPTELARLEDLDIKKYKEMLQSSLEQVLDALDISFDEVMGVKKIDSFFTKSKPTVKPATKPAAKPKHKPAPKEEEEDE